VLTLAIGAVLAASHQRQDIASLKERTPGIRHQRRQIAL
jgi:hypothetical protein